jgi:glycosyltransferase involved in cell wall biosynthesis
VHVGLNLVYLVPGETGGLETYARELIAALVHERPDLRLTAFVGRAAASADGPWNGLIPSVTLDIDSRRRTEWVRAEQQLLPPAAARAGVELVHSLASTAPAWGRFRRVVTIHDLIYRRYPEAHFGLRSVAMRLLVPLAARRAQRIIVPSEATRDDLTGLLSVPEGKIDVVPNGIGAAGGPALAEDELRRQHDLGARPFVLAVSAKRPHKNLPRLLDALALIPDERRPAVVIPGYSTPHEHELRLLAAALGLERDVRLPAWVPPEELEGLYRAAACVVVPSLYEGFGLPVLEAMTRGVPVACSDRGALAEVAGGAAELFDPERPEAIAWAIERLLSDPYLRDSLTTRGRARAAEFSWAATARSTAASYERALGSA